MWPNECCDVSKSEDAGVTFHVAVKMLSARLCLNANS